MTPQALKAGEVAEMLAISERQVHRLMASGALPSHRFGGCRRVSRAFLEEFLASPCETLTEFAAIRADLTRRF